MAAPGRPLTDAERDLAAENYPLALWAARRAPRSPVRRHEPDEAVSDACVVLVRCARAFRADGGAAFSTYFIRAVMPYLRARAWGKRWPGPELELIDTYGGSAHGLARDDPALAAADGADLDVNALLALAGDNAEALRLRYLEGLKCRDVARRLGCSHEAVRLRCLRGLRRIRKALGVD